MRISTMALTAVAAIGFSAMQASAATLLIDGFETDQLVVDVPTGTDVSSSEVGGADILGGFRDMAVTNDSGTPAGTELRSVSSVAGGFLGFSNLVFNSGTGIITYDGAGAAGLGGVDLTLGGLSNPMFVFEVLDFDLDVAFSVAIRDTAGLFATYSETLTGGFNPNLEFTEFTTDAGFDFASVDSLMFTVSSSTTDLSVDGAIGSISISAVPLPASALLLLGGLGGLGALRRRKNKATA